MNSASNGILKQEIERFRNENRAPILKIASRYFRKLTLGSFEALRTDEDDRGQPVRVGLRHQKPRSSSLPITGGLQRKP